jgi:hypothetical protein
VSRSVELIGGVQVSVETGTALVIGLEPKDRNVCAKLDDPILRGKLRHALSGWIDKSDAETLALAERVKGTGTLVSYRIEVHRDAKVDPALPIAEVPQDARYRRLVSLTEVLAETSPGPGPTAVPNTPAADDGYPGPATDADATKPWIQHNGDGSLNLGSYAAQAAAGMIDVAVEALRAAGVTEPRIPAVKALASRLLAVADAAQATATGRPADRMAASHTRARGLLRTALAVHPAPVGASTEDRQRWQNDLTSYTTLLLCMVADLDAHRMPALVSTYVDSAPASGGLATDAERQAAIAAARQVDDTDASRDEHGETDRDRLARWMNANKVPPLIHPELTSDQAMRLRAYLANADGARSTAA